MVLFWSKRNGFQRLVQTARKGFGFQILAQTARKGYGTVDEKLIVDEKAITWSKSARKSYNAGENAVEKAIMVVKKL
jgi:hypothetical protein